MEALSIVHDELGLSISCGAGEEQQKRLKACCESCTRVLDATK